MKKIGVALLFTALFLTGCTYSVRRTTYRPAAPYETMGANYAPMGKVTKSIRYYRDFDFHTFGPVPVWHASYFLMEDGLLGKGKVPMSDKYDFETNKVYSPDGVRRMYLRPPEAYLVGKALEDNSSADTILNVSFVDTCDKVEWYIVPLIGWNWYMNDSECELTMKGTLGKLR